VKQKADAKIFSSKEADVCLVI